MLNVNEHTETKSKPKPTMMQIYELIECMCVSLCMTVVHNTAQNISDYFPS